MEKQQTWPKGNQLLTVIAAVWCITSWIIVDVAATSGDEKTTSKVVVEGVVYCEGLSQHHELLKDAEVQVECTNHDTKAREIGRTNAQGMFTITLQDYDYETWGSNGCKAKLISSLRATCTTPTNMGGGLTGTNLVLKEKSNEKLVLTAGPFAFKQSGVVATSEKSLQKREESKDSSSYVGSGLWYSPPNNYHYTSPSPPHYESPPYLHKSRGHEGHRERHGHKSRETDCSPRKESHHHKSPVHHPPPYYYKSPPPYHSEHHDAPRHESSPYYKSPPYSNRDYPPHHYTFPPPAGYNHMSPPYTPYVHHTPSPPPHHDTYEAPPKQFYPPPYYQSSNVDNDV